MKALVSVKRVIDPSVKVVLKQDNIEINSRNVRMSMNPFDERAVEEAVRLKESGFLHEVIVISFGVLQSQDVLRTALAMGADRAILVQTEGDLQPLAVAKLLRAIIDRETPDLVLLGKQAIDDDCGQVGPMLAGLLGWPQGVSVSKVKGTPHHLMLTQEIEEGQQTITLKWPAVITVDLCLNTPRYVSLPNIVKARQKPLDIFVSTDFNIDLSPRLTVKRLSEPSKRKAGRQITDAASLIEALVSEAKVLG